MSAVILAALLVPSSAHAGDCVDLVEALAVVRSAVEEVRLDEAAVMAEQTVDALSCQEAPVNPLLLTSVFQLQGAVAHFRGDPGEADAAFRRAVAVAPMSTLDARFGEDAAATYRAVQRSVLAESNGTITVAGQVDAWIDGRLVELGTSLELPVGYHLLQWREGEDIKLHSRTLRMAVGEARVLPLGADAIVEGQPVRAERDLDWAPYARAGGGLVLLAGAGVLLAGAKAYQDFERTDDPMELETHQSRNHALVIAGASTAAVGAGVIGVSFVDGGWGLGLELRF